MQMLVDYSSLLFRAYHAMPDSVPMQGVYGFLNMLARLLRDRRPARLCIAVDDDWRPAFRTDALPSYKAHRVSDEPDPVAPQEEVGRELLEALGIAVVGADGFEAEDIIATIAARAREPVEVVSGDRDLFALVRDAAPAVTVLYPVRGVSELAVVDEAEITRRYGIPGRAYLDFALLRGDPSDGLPGVAGIGEKTATKLIAEHASLDGLLAARNLPAAVARRLDARATTSPRRAASCRRAPTCRCRGWGSISRASPRTRGPSPASRPPIRSTDRWAVSGPPWPNFLDTVEAPRGYPTVDNAAPRHCWGGTSP
jgi:5'-3' exonuclease